MLNERGRIIATREHNLSPGPRFSLIRGNTSCAWAVRADVSDSLAAEIDELAREEPPADDCRHEPLHADRYAALLGGRRSAFASARGSHQWRLKPGSRRLHISAVAVWVRV